MTALKSIATGLLAAFVFLPTALGNSAAGTTQEISVPAPSLQGNLLQDAASQRAIVYLPPSYAEQPLKRYPVLYLLHGFSLHSVLDDWKEVITESMDSFVSANPGESFIVVIPNGANAVHGSFYMDSSVAGNWEQFITKDLLGYVDSHYRTIPDRLSRAVAGHSMGGFAALRLALLHADEFATAYAMSPCCIDLQGDMTASNPAWKEVFQVHSLNDIQALSEKGNFWAVALSAFAIAASPDPRAIRLADLPYREEHGSIVDVPAVIREWRGKMPLGLADSPTLDTGKISGISIDYGYEDNFSHIPLTCQQLGQKLLDRKIPVVIEGYHGDHNNGVPPRVATRVLPYVAEHLKFQ